MSIPQQGTHSMPNQGRFGSPVVRDIASGIPRLPSTVPTPRLFPTHPRPAVSSLATTQFSMSELDAEGTSHTLDGIITETELNLIALMETSLSASKATDIDTIAPDLIRELQGLRKCHRDLNRVLAINKKEPMYLDFVRIRTSFELTMRNDRLSEMLRDCAKENIQLRRPANVDAQDERFLLLGRLVDAEERAGNAASRSAKGEMDFGRRELRLLQELRDLKETTETQHIATEKTIAEAQKTVQTCFQTINICNATISSLESRIHDLSRASEIAAEHYHAERERLQKQMDRLRKQVHDVQQASAQAAGTHTSNQARNHARKSTNPAQATGMYPFDRSPTGRSRARNEVPDDSPSSPAETAHGTIWIKGKVFVACYTPQQDQKPPGLGTRQADKDKDDNEDGATPQESQRWSPSKVGFGSLHFCPLATFLT